MQSANCAPDRGIKDETNRYWYAWRRILLHTKIVTPSDMGKESGSFWLAL